MHETISEKLSVSRVGFRKRQSYGCTLPTLSAINSIQKSTQLYFLKLIKSTFISHFLGRVQQYIYNLNHLRWIASYNFMKKTFYINNYLNQKTNQTPNRTKDQSNLPESRSEKPDYYEQYLEKYNLQHSESAVPQTAPPIKRTTTAETTEFSYKPTTARQENYRKDSEDSQKNLATQRIYFERSNAGDRNWNGVNNNGSQLPNSKSEKQWQLELELNINKLKDIKSYLENEIGMLQQLLDETSHNLDNVDIEFGKIKERVLDYTSRSLDAALRNYKKRMVRWSKYEEVEKKGIQVVLEMREFIKQGEQVLDELRQGANVSSLTNSMREVANRVDHYQVTTNEIKKLREECLSRHPTLKEEKVLEFERVLEELCCF